MISTFPMEENSVFRKDHTMCWTWISVFIAYVAVKVNCVLLKSLIKVLSISMNCWRFSPSEKCQLQVQSWQSEVYKEYFESIQRWLMSTCRRASIPFNAFFNFLHETSCIKERMNQSVFPLPSWFCRYLTFSTSNFQILRSVILH